MADKLDLKLLAEVLAVAERPDRDLDAEIALALGTAEDLIEGMAGAGLHVRACLRGSSVWDAFRRGTLKVTESMDDAARLARAILPDWHWGMNSEGNAILYRDNPILLREAEASTPALALCLVVARTKYALSFAEAAGEEPGAGLLRG